MIGFTRTAGTGGGGGGSAITFSPITVFQSSGISSSGWTATDGTTNITVNAGTFSASAGEYVEVTGSNTLRMSFNIPGSYYAFGIKCRVDPSFTPVNTNNWYQASTLLSQELANEQKDYGAVIDKNGYFALGWANSTITSSNVSALDGQTHEVFVIAFDSTIKLIVDGVEVVSVTKTMNGGEMSNLGVMWNKDNPNTRVNGRVYSVGCWSYTIPAAVYDLPTLS